MFMIFNKEFRKTEAIMSELLKKMENSANVKEIYKGNAEIYKLDTIDIVFDIHKHELLANDKDGNKIISLDCHYDHNDELQYTKWKLFGSFLNKVRQTYGKRIDKELKLKNAAAKARRAEEAKQRYISAQQAKEQVLNDALNKLRGM